MLVHTVYFWLKPELTAAQRADFRRGVESLAGIKSVEKIYVGQPAKTEKQSPTRSQSHLLGRVSHIAPTRNTTAGTTDSKRLVFSRLRYRTRRSNPLAGVKVKPSGST